MIHLACKGTWSFPAADIINNPLNKSISIDFTASQVRGPHGTTYQIVEVDEAKILFSAPLEERRKLPGELLGYIDRLTGDTFVMAVRYPPEGEGIVWETRLSCQRAMPRF